MKSALCTASEHEVCTRNLIHQSGKKFRCSCDCHAEVEDESESPTRDTSTEES